MCYPRLVVLSLCRNFNTILQAPKRCTCCCCMAVLVRSLLSTVGTCTYGRYTVDCVWYLCSSRESLGEYYILHNEDIGMLRKCALLRQCGLGFYLTRAPSEQWESSAANSWSYRTASRYALCLAMQHRLQWPRGHLRSR